MQRFLAPLSGPAFAAMRIVLAFLYLTHGFQKLFGMFGGHTVPLASSLGAAGMIEAILGPLIVVGLFTSVAAFIASGEMAFAYFIAHAPRGLWPAQNGGELPVALCFAFLYIAAHGGGRFSLDHVIGASRREPIHPSK